MLDKKDLDQQRLAVDQIKDKKLKLKIAPLGNKQRVAVLLKLIRKLKKIDNIA